MGANEKNNREENNFLVVGLGASAGGLEPLKQFFKSLPEKTGMAFIVVVHLSRKHESYMAELLQSHTSLNVRQIHEKTLIEPDCVYVIPPKKRLLVKDNYIEVLNPENKSHIHRSVSQLFSSLAEEMKNHAVGIILSGSGSDGLEGIITIQEYDGFIIAQNPREAEFSDMPQNAINTGLVDMVLPVNKIANELFQRKISLHQTPKDKEAGYKKVLQQILGLLHFQTGHDFSNYKQASVLRRINRRMHVNRVGSLSDYLSFLKDHPEEINNLLKNLLISVTNFFRDPEAFEALANEIIPLMFKGKGPEDILRIWIPGCATGEEAYSIAILMHEYAQNLEMAPAVQIFATDIDEHALNTARRGRYLESIESVISTERLQRYFNKTDHHYQIKKEIHGMVLFARHNLISDPPFSNLDLIVCRNLLIYLNKDLHFQVINLFHYALYPGCWLFLGSSDSIHKANELFTPINKEYRLYQRDSAPAVLPQFPDMPLHLEMNRRTATRLRGWPSEKKPDYEGLHMELLLKMYSFHSAIINENYEVIHSTGGIHKYLGYSGGKPSLNILEMIKPEMRQALRKLLFQAEKKETPAGPKTIRTSIIEGSNNIELQVHRINEPGFPKDYFHVVIKESESGDESRKVKHQTDEEQLEDDDNGIIESLVKELEYTRGQLHLAYEENDTSSEQLKASNEELQTMNEELKFLNHELENKIEKLSRANSDLKNLMESIEVGILFVDREFCIQLYTSSTTEIFNLIPSDLGRPIDHITHSLNYDSFRDDLAHVLNHEESTKKIVNSKDKRWFSMGQRPYRTMDDEIEGVVITFVDITQLKDAEEKLKQQKQQESLALLGLYALERNDIDSIMSRAIKQICIILETDYALLFLQDEKTNMLHLGSQSGLTTDETEIENNEKWDIGYALRAKDNVFVKNYRAEKRFSLSPVLEGIDIASGLHLKIKGSEKTYGILSLYTREKCEFSITDLNFARVMAQLIGMSVERLETKSNLEETNRQLKIEIQKSEQYQREILNSSVVERWKIGSYLHDNLAQMLASIKIMLMDLSHNLQDDKTVLKKKIAKLIGIIDEGMSGIRDLTHDIIPIDIEDEGVAHAFRFLIRQTQKMHNVNCRLNTDDSIHKIKNRKLATNIYHVVQEAIKNAAIHGKAKNILITVRKSNGDMKLQVKDDGHGIAFTQEELNKRNSKGLRIMKYRMELLGGTFNIEKISDPDKSGTIVTCTIPLKDLY